MVKVVMCSDNFCWIDAIRADGYKAAHGGLLGGPHQPKCVDAISVGVADEVGSQRPSPVELTRFDTDPVLHESHESASDVALGEGKLFGPVCRSRHFYFGAG